MASYPFAGGGSSQKSPSLSLEATRLRRDYGYAVWSLTQPFDGADNPFRQLKAAVP
jgi:hypothetical protein